MELQQMQFGAVTFVLAERILWKFGAEVTHDSVTRDLGDDAGGSDAQTEAIAIDNSGLRNWKWNNGQAIYQNVIRRDGERFDCNAHRPMRCPQDVDSINLDMIDKTDSPGDLRVAGKVGINLLTQFRRQLFGIIQAPVTEFFWKNDGSRNNGTRQSTAASLVDSSDTSHAGAAECFLVTKSAAPTHRAKNTEKRKAEKPKDFSFSEFTRVVQSPLCLCGYEDNLIWRDERDLAALPPPLQSVVNATEKRAPHPRHRRFGAL
jgi:hypothetical protein